jgi:hypothetical protein
MTDAEITAQLAVWLGPTVTSRLTTRAQRATAHRVFRMIADTERPDTARAWMVGTNPHLDDDNPLLAIADGRGHAVMRAARAYLSGVST